MHVRIVIMPLLSLHPTSVVINILHYLSLLWSIPLTINCSLVNCLSSNVLERAQSNSVQRHTHKDKVCNLYR